MTKPSVKHDLFVGVDLGQNHVGIGMLSDGVLSVRHLDLEPVGSDWERFQRYTETIPDWIISIIPYSHNYSGVHVIFEDFLFQGGARTTFNFMNRVLGACYVKMLAPAMQLIVYPPLANRRWELDMGVASLKKSSRSDLLYELLRDDDRLILDRPNEGRGYGVFIKGEKVNEHEVDALFIAKWLETEVVAARRRGIPDDEIPKVIKTTDRRNQTPRLRRDWKPVVRKALRKVRK